MCDHVLRFRRGDDVWSASVTSRIIEASSREFSDRIRESIREGKDQTTLSIHSDLNISALLFLVNSLQAGIAVHTPAQDFDFLLNLSQAIWIFKCRPDIFSHFAATIRDREWTTNDRRGNILGWAFIAFIFGWEKYFDVTTRELITGSCDEDVWSGYISDIFDLKGQRLDLMKATYTFIRNICFAQELENSKGYPYLRTELRKMNIDIGQDPDVNENLTNPTKYRLYKTPLAMVDLFQGIIQSVTMNGVPTNKSSSESENSHHQDTLTTQHTSGTRGAGNYRSGKTRQILKEKLGFGSPSGWTARDRRDWDRIFSGTLDPAIHNFKERWFRGLQLRQFDEIRRNHMINL